MNLMRLNGPVEIISNSGPNKRTLTSMQGNNVRIKQIIYVHKKRNVEPSSKDSYTKSCDTVLVMAHQIFSQFNETCAWE